MMCETRESWGRLGSVAADGGKADMLRENELSSALQAERDTD